MPSKKKKYNARFPAGRIKKIMQSDEEVGKVAQAVPVIISRTLEMFVCSLLQKAMQVTSAKNAKTLTPTHMKQCILSEQRFDFLKDLVKTVQDSANGDDDMSGAASSQLVSAPNRALHQRRKSSCGSTKEETVIKKVTLIKEEPIEECSQMSDVRSTIDPLANCSTTRFSPNFYSESVSEQRKMGPLIKVETITEPPSNCSTTSFSTNVYSESVSEQMRGGNLIKTETITEPVANCSTLHSSPNFYSEPLTEQKKEFSVLKTETVTESPTNRSNVRFCPNFYSETVPEQSNTTGLVSKTDTVIEHPHVMANCSTLHFGPRFFPETFPEQKVSTHSLSVCPPSSVPCQKTTRIASLSMDEDYDT